MGTLYDKEFDTRMKSPLTRMANFTENKGCAKFHSQSKKRVKSRSGVRRAYTILVETQNGKDYLEDLSINMEIILKEILNK